ncbi:hypothetical protein FRB99_002909 [Tulasnella sp. 403]|nr:hypothetical protein FRB99_002909 [Tulasnella sp. 403]
MPALIAPQPELYGIPDDADAYRQLAHHQRDSDLLSRYPTFPTSSPRGSPNRISIEPPMVPPSPSNPSFKVKRIRDRRSAEPVRDATNTTPAIQVSEVSPDQTGASWYDQDTEARKPKKIAKSAHRPPPPSRIPPERPVEYSPSYYPQTFLPPPSPSGILITEPAHPFSRPMGPPKSAMKSPKPTQQPSPLPQTALLSPDSAHQRRFALRHGPPPPTFVYDRNASSPYVLSPATSNGRLSSATGSHRGSSAATSSVAFTSSSVISNSYAYSNLSQSYSNPASRPARDDGEPDEDIAPRTTLFVVNADPETSESEQSPVESKIPKFSPVPPAKPATLRKKMKAPEVARTVPPVPPLPPQFQAPPPPAYPPSADYSRGVPNVASPPKSRSDRTTMKRNSTDNNSPAQHATAQPGPIVPPRSSNARASGAASLARSDSSGTQSSSSSSPVPFVPSLQASLPGSPKDGIPAEWLYPLPLTLEELFRGGKYTYRITTRLLSGAPKIQEVEIDVKPGWKSGTRIIFPGAGNERSPGVFQDMIFVVEQVHHERFARLDGGRLVLNQDIDVTDALKEGVRRSPRKIVGLDGQMIEFTPPSGVIKPGMETVIKGHGMYIRSKSQVVGRGDLIIRWNVCFPNHVTQDQLARMRDIFK